MEVPLLSQLALAQLMRAYGGGVTEDGGRLREAVRRRYPILGWREAEDAVDEVMDGLVEEAGLAQVAGGRVLGAMVRQQRDAWINEVHEVYSLESCVLFLCDASEEFVRQWWWMAMGHFAGIPPGATYINAERRGGFLWTVFRDPTVPHVITPNQGVAQVIHPTTHGAGNWEAALRPGGMPSICDYLNDCEQRFLFGVVYMDFTWAERARRMLQVLEDLVRMRRRGEMDTEDEAVMGWHWASSWVADLMLRTAPGQRLAAPR